MNVMILISKEVEPKPKLKYIFFNYFIIKYYTNLVRLSLKPETYM